LTVGPHQPGKDRVVTVVRLVARKNLATIIQAVARLRATFTRIQYDVIGDRPEKENLVALAASLGISAQVTFHGQVSDQKKIELLRQATVFVMAPKVLAQG